MRFDGEEEGGLEEHGDFAWNRIAATTNIVT
jgi:hypothetical protein